MHGNAHRLAASLGQSPTFNMYRKNTVQYNVDFGVGQLKAATTAFNNYFWRPVFLRSTPFRST
jgi:hypothetical protein